ncbi:hypothetical protein GB931_21965 [Modestobacter sp. I12A-02628]|uniref:DUF6434 domain-containing protein n=1 Tax=Goekera deserti TaxID=2497753 RepID=A0A7K3WM16_9ACTN|nr:DUF6434 domain-containing protein [Goekera deserti]MPR00541.1 hypothetical protein [Goekera deserti]NDI50477.1 hypothetical protein [Goekera deserti]NEL56573.1 hypothetical protein [Goekera deserti]
MPESRPPLTPALSGAELRRWYWLRAELAPLARTLGVPGGGGKQELTDRLAAALDGRPVAPAPRRGVGAARLPEPLTEATVLPAGQRCTQQLRAWFTAQVGPAFRFDGPMREFVAGGAGRTLGDALEHWHTTRARPRGEIGEQFELNRFVRAWHLQHPDGARADALAAWRAHRALPVDAREASAP